MIGAVGTPEAAATVDVYCDLVSGPLAILLNTYPATIVPVGGGLSGTPALIDELDRRVRQGLLRATNKPILVATQLAGDAGILGAFIAAGGRTGAEPDYCR